MASCSAVNCGNGYRKGYVLVRFPNDENLRKVWEQAVGRPNLKPTHNNRLCEVHFRDDQWNEELPNLLKSNAVPSLFCNCALRLVEGSRKPLGNFNRNSDGNFGDHAYSSPTINSSVHDALCPLYGVGPKRKTLPKPPKPPSIPRASHGGPPTKKSKKDAILKKENKRLKAVVANLTKKLEQTKNDVQTVTEELKKEEEWWHGRFGADQIVAAKTRNSKGRKWTTESVVKGLQIRALGGSSGLKSASQVLFPLPSERTLQRRTKNINFEPGVLHQILDAFEEELKTFEEDDLDCLIFFDDMSIKSRVDYDNGTHSCIGQVTLPNVGGPASKAIIFVFGGVRKKWKVTAAYHFIPNHGCPEELKQVLLELLEVALKKKLNVLGFVCDMGNRSVLNLLGFSFCKDSIVNCVPHPLDPTKKLYCFPDMVHLFKSFKEVWGKSGRIVLSPDIVAQFALPSQFVEFEHVTFLSEFQEDMDLKFIPKLNTKELEASHFRKMNLPNAKCILDDKVGATLDFLVQCGEAPDECSTTAWFVRLMNRWFKLVTSRNLSCALSKHNQEAYMKAIEDLKFVVQLMKEISFDGKWQVVQTHIIIATESILAIQEELLSKSGYNYLLLGRFLQDLVENIFSILRAICPTPSALEFKYSLKRVVLGQFFFHVSKSSYEADDRVEAVGLEQLLKSAQQQSVPHDVTAVQLPSWEEPPDIGSVAEESLFYRQCGYIVRTLMKKKMLQCKTCLAALQHHGDVPHPLATFTRLTNYAENAQIEVSDDVYQLLRRIEFNLRRWKLHLKTIPYLAAENVMKRLPEDILHSVISPCHHLTYKFLFAFINSRLKQFTVLYNTKQQDMAPSSLASKTMGKKLLADNLRIGVKKTPSQTAQRSVPEAVARRLLM